MTRRGVIRFLFNPKRFRSNPAIENLGQDAFNPLPSAREVHLDSLVKDVMRGGQVGVVSGVDESDRDNP